MAHRFSSHRFRSVAWLSWTLLGVACGQADPAEHEGSPGRSGGAASGSSTSPPEGYPAGPYGEANPAVGDVIENLAFRGYRRQESGVVVDGGNAVDFWMEDLRGEGSLLFIHTATVWCSSCRAAADSLGPLGDELSERGAVILELILEGSDGSLPSDEQLALWARNSNLTVTTARPENDRGPEVFPSREYGYIIDLSSMEVIWQKQALFSVPTIAEQGAEQLALLLER